ncbi:PH domain-containing protein [Tessaracoccus sp. OH4464_COT-324]|uniref:PH domain-containing protein n=1 Tax=Tessaracoccus sp. OH4464_COT-324 TaxID=2491059 RepID=UPI001319C197|nr:PH domain-containing protein [Tessaracoccus sp. OH4464_COT-324]
MKRNDPRMLAVRSAQVMLTYLPFMVAQGTIASMLPSWATLPWAILIIYYTITRFTYISVDWLTTRWFADHNGLAVQTGWPARSRVTVTWSEIGTLDVRQGWAARLLGVRTIIASVGADGCSKLTLEAVSAVDAERLVKFHGQFDNCAAGAGEPPEATIVHRSRSIDFLAIGFTHGQFLLVVPFLIGSGADLMELAGLELVTIAGWLAGLGVAPAIFLVTALALGYGTFRSALAYHGHTVRQHSWGYSTSGGLFQRASCEARLEHVVGVRVDRNPLMLLTGTCSVHLVLDTGRGDSRSLPLLPLISWRDLDHHLERLLPQSKPSQTTRRTFAEPVLVILSSIGLALAILPVFGLWIAGLLVTLGLLVANALCVKLAHGASTVWIETGLLSRRLRIVEGKAVRELSYVLWPGFRLGSRGWLGLKVLDRRIRVHWIPRVPCDLARSLWLHRAAGAKG